MKTKDPKQNSSLVALMSAKRRYKILLARLQAVYGSRVSVVRTGGQRTAQLETILLEDMSDLMLDFILRPLKIS